MRVFLARLRILLGNVVQRVIPTEHASPQHMTERAINP